MFANILTKETSQKADSSKGIPLCRKCSFASSFPAQAERGEIDTFVWEGDKAFSIVSRKRNHGGGVGGEEEGRKKDKSERRERAVENVVTREETAGRPRGEKKG